MDSAEATADKRQTFTLIYAAFVAGLCSIVYELLIATTVSYFLGNSVQYFSVTIGLYMAAMGIGSFVSKYIDKDILYTFIVVEAALGLLGGLSIPLLYLSYSVEGLFVPTYVALTISVGFLIGLEIPFLTRLMESFQSLKFNIANILSFDYAGALIATLAFPFFLLPVLGNYQSSLVLGLINLSIVAVLINIFSAKLAKKKGNATTLFLVVLAILLSALIFAHQVLEKWDQSLYSGRIIHAEQTPYQKIILTKYKDDIRLYLDGNIQFSSTDEHRYHESLVVFPLVHMETPIKRVLLLGAGDGLAIRELLKYDEVEEIVLVDLDKNVVELAKSNPYLSQLNQGSLEDNKVEIIFTDAFRFLKENEERFDLIISDLPDPNNLSLSRLYSKQFYQMMKGNLSINGLMVTQATSPYYAKEAFWSITNTVKAAGFGAVVPYHADIPSFGDWGFVMAKQSSVPFEFKRALSDVRYLNDAMLSSMRVFGSDQMSDTAEVNMLDKPVLLSYYLEGWRTYGY
ncbi:polyamine aminopropyltransferase [Alteromonadaceae bacterium M269]|nr:polyamine aminopropyltransferase [Alteromonadaceae bacterium M269]